MKEIHDKHDRINTNTILDSVKKEYMPFYVLMLPLVAFQSIQGQFFVSLHLLC